MPKSTAIATLEEAPHPVIQKLESLIEDLGMDSASAALSIAQSILETDDIEALLEGGVQSEVINGDDYIGVPFYFYGIHGVGKSRYENSALPYFLILRVKLVNADEEVLMTTGSSNVVAAAIVLHERDALPRTVKIVQTTEPTSSGYFPQWLRKATDEDITKAPKRKGAGAHTLKDGTTF